MKARALCILLAVLMWLCGCTAEMNHSTAPTVAPTTVPTTAFDIEREYPWYRKLRFHKLYVHESITCQQDIVDEINALMQMSASDGYLEFYVYTDLYVNEEIFSAIDYFELSEGVYYTLRVKHECIDIEKLAELAKEPVVHKILIDVHPRVIPE